MNKFKCLASIFEDAIDVERNLRFDPLEFKCTMKPQEIQGETIKDVMQNFVSTDVFDSFFEQHTEQTIFLYYVDLSGVLVRFDEMFDM